MPTSGTQHSPADGRAGRGSLDAEQVIAGAVALADEIGMAAFTIRRLAEAIDSKPMTIYHHVPNKEAIIDGMVDAVFAEIALPPTDTDWRSAMVVRCASMRQVLARHPWAAPETHRSLAWPPSTTPCSAACAPGVLVGDDGPRLRPHRRPLRFACEATLPATAGEEMHELASSMMAQMPTDLFPHLVEFTVGHAMASGYDFGQEFSFGLDLILDGLERAATAS
ncbi:MAG: TetR family transcriptional regulator [Acidimicrobiales bacterium]